MLAPNTESENSLKGLYCSSNQQRRKLASKAYKDYYFSMQTNIDLLAQIDDLKGQLDSMRPLDKEIENRVLQKFRLWWTYHSNAIEGNRLTQGETEMFLMEGLTAKGKPLKDHLDLRGHSNAVNYLLDFIRTDDQLTEATIRKLHEVLLVEPYNVPAITAQGQSTTKTVMLGEYKTQPNHVLTPTGEMHYYATPLDTPSRMRELVERQRRESASKQLHAIESISHFHYDFTAIHPFDDGNGRMARLLMNLLLMQKGFPPAVIRIEERDDYLRTLREADQGDLAPFVQFIAEHVKTSLEIYLQGIKGEDIHEPSDLDKEISLLKLELQHIEEPKLLNSTDQRKVLIESINPLIDGLVKSISPLGDLFSDSTVSLSGINGITNTRRDFRKLWKLQGAKKPQIDPDSHSNGTIIYNLKIEFQLLGFKKARFNNFDTSASIEALFETHKYIVRYANLQFTHYYQEQLGKDEITKLIDTFARFFLDVIRKKTNPKE